MSQRNRVLAYQDRHGVNLVNHSDPSILEISHNHRAIDLYDHDKSNQSYVTNWMTGSLST